MSWYDLSIEDLKFLAEYNLATSQEVIALPMMQLQTSYGRPMTDCDDRYLFPDVIGYDVMRGTIPLREDEALAAVHDIRAHGLTYQPNLDGLEFSFGNREENEAVDDYLQRVGIIKNGQVNREFVAETVKKVEQSFVINEARMANFLASL